MPKVQQKSLPRLLSTSKLTFLAGLFEGLGVSTYLPYIALSQVLLSCTTAPTLKSPVHSKSVFLVQRPGVTLVGSQVHLFLVFLLTLPELKAGHMVSHVPHRQQFNSCRNVEMANAFRGHTVCYRMCLEAVTF